MRPIQTDGGGLTILKPKHEDQRQISENCWNFLIISIVNGVSLSATFTYTGRRPQHMRPCLYHVPQNIISEQIYPLNVCCKHVNQ